jgi:hypothetical protein
MDTPGLEPGGSPLPTSGSYLSDLVEYPPGLRKNLHIDCIEYNFCEQRNHCVETDMEGV